MPKVSGSAETYISSRTKKMLDAAFKEAQRLNDEFVSIEHLLIVIAEERGSEAAKILSSLGVSKDGIFKVLTEIRGSQRVTDQNPEEKVSGPAALFARSDGAGAQGKARSGHWPRIRRSGASSRFSRAGPRTTRC